jgi:FAD:protein FMN transferase
MVLSTSSSDQTVCERVRRSAQATLAEGVHRLTFQAMNTVCRVLVNTSNRALAREFHAEVLEWVGQFEARYSRFIPDSLIGRINAAAGLHWVDVDSETDALFDLCQEMTFFTRGVFDPTALPLIRLWNWKANPPVVPTSEAIQRAQQLVGWRHVQRRPGAIFLPREGMALDLGGIGKEYAVDRVLELGLQRGLQGLLVDFGADVRAQGHPPNRSAWHVGLEDPRNPGHAWVGLAVAHQAVATSGDYLRFFSHQGRRYGHILDPRTGYPVSNSLLSVSVIAPHCTFAGILSTSAFVLGPKEGADLIRLCPGVEGSIISESTRFQTKGFYAYTTS